MGHLDHHLTYLYPFGALHTSIEMGERVLLSLYDVLVYELVYLSTDQSQMQQHLRDIECLHHMYADLLVLRLHFVADTLFQSHYHQFVALLPDLIRF